LLENTLGVHMSGKKNTDKANPYLIEHKQCSRYRIKLRQIFVVFVTI